MDYAFAERIAVSICRQFKAYDLLEDVKQEARLAYWQCSETYKPEVGTTLNQYSRLRVNGAAIDCLRKHFCGNRARTLKPILVPIDEVARTLRVETQTALINRIEANRLLLSIKRPHWNKVAIMYYSEGFGTLEISQKFGYSHGRASQVLHSATEKMKDLAGF